jgi:elongation factor 1 alpha-like protein
LLGGSPDGAPKISKLQALAAARKKKTQEQKSSAITEGMEKPLEELAISRTSRVRDQTEPPDATDSATRSSPRAYPLRKRKNSSPHRNTIQPAEPIEQSNPEPLEDEIPAPVVEQAKPSAFASTMFGNSEPASKHIALKTLFTLPYLAYPSSHSTDAFAGPSPDDVVLAKQSESKGSMNSAKTRK